MHKNRLMKLFVLSVFLISVVSWSYTGCFNDNSAKASREQQNKVEEEPVFQLKVHEPSGLAFSSSGDALYVVSDRNGVVYRIDFTGEVIEKLPFQGHDLEGIEVDKVTGEFWLVEERKQNILHLSSNGDLIEIITDVRVDTKYNRGFEGVAKNGDILYILMESNPGSLIEYNIPSKKWIRHKLDFAKDYSGIDYDPSDNTLWIVSHESKTLNHCNTDGKLISIQEIDVKQAEGVAVDQGAKIAWIVSDAGSKLHKITLKN